MPGTITWDAIPPEPPVTDPTRLVLRTPHGRIVSSHGDNPWEANT